MTLPLNSKGKPVSVDPRCWDLAELFLAEFKGEGTTDAHVADLAEEIQRCCESGSDEAGDRRAQLRATHTATSETDVGGTNATI